MNPFAYVLPLLVLGAGLYFQYWAKQQRRVQAEQHPESKAGAIAARLGLALIEGDPEFNLVYNERGQQFASAGVMRNPVPELRLRIAGTLYDRPVEIAYQDRIETAVHFDGTSVTLTIFCRIAAATRCGFPPFEITLRSAPMGMEPRARMQHLPESSFGDPNVDRQLVLRCADPRVGPAILPYLGPVRALTYVHITGENAMVAYELSQSFGLMMLGSADMIVFVLASLSSVMEGSAPPVPMSAPIAPGATTSPVASAAPSSFGDEQLPVPCTRCGAPMQDASPHGALTGSTMQCPYCRAVEQLPTEVAARTNALRARIAQLRWAQAAIEGPERAFAGIVETYKSRPMLLMLGAMGVVMLYSFANGAIAAVSTARSPMDVIPVFIMPAFVIGMVVSYQRLFARYRKLVRPKLYARPPLEPGRPMRCRHCGGNLPPSAEPFVSCSYCGTQNLATHDVANERAALLDAEVREYQARAANVQTAMLEAIDARAFTRTMYLTAGLVVGGVLVVAMIATALIQALS
jgi:hypothetical protein